ncbi:MAG TPA: hypothetical protein VGQ33_18325, partial [Vicinamibacteria bacterium]|nr:hypothetical protein [Vicinamibacteria bacterium]
MILAITVLLLGGGAAANGGVELPAGTSLSVRLTSAIPAHAKPDLAVSAVLIAPVVQDGAVVLSSGATVRGVVEAARALPHERHRSYLRIAFHEVVTDTGALPVVAQVSDVDNARESVDADGRIVGLGWVPVRPTRVEALLLLAAHAHPVALAALEAGKLAVRQVGRVPIEYAPGTEMTVTLTEPLHVTVTTAAPRPSDLSTDNELARLAADLPTRTEVPRLQRPADLTN